MRFGEPHLSPGKRSYQTEHVGTTKLQRVMRVEYALFPKSPIMGTGSLPRGKVTSPWR